MFLKMLRFILGSSPKTQCAGLFVLNVFISAVVCLAAEAGNPGTQAKVTESAVKAVTQAVTDEIYSMGYYTEYLELGHDKVPIYIDPYIRNNLIWTIYKLPIGEVFRAAYMRKDGLAVLIGDPRNDFPPTNRAATKTLYMDDEDVIRMKTTWLKRYFSIEISPSTKEIQEANRRQELRKGENSEGGK